MKYKVGDQVTIDIPNEESLYNGLIGTVVKLHNHSIYKYIIKFNNTPKVWVSNENYFKEDEVRKPTKLERALK